MLEKNEILLSSQSLGDALRKLYQLEKARQPYFSIQYICSKAKIPSKGHLADVMGKRRTLKLEYAKPLARVFNLAPPQTKVFVGMAKNEKARNLIDKKKLSNQLNVAKKKLKILETSFVKMNGEPFDFSRVFCAMGVVTKPATAQKIAETLNMPITEVKDHLCELVDRGFLKKENDIYSLSTNEVHFSRGEYVNMIHSYLKASQRNIDRWIDSENSFFESSTISVSQATYKSLLPKLREFVLDTISELEIDEGDQLVHFNLQVYPDR